MMTCHVCGGRKWRVLSRTTGENAISHRPEGTIHGMNNTYVYGEKKFDSRLSGFPRTRFHNLLMCFDFWFLHCVHLIDNVSNKAYFQNKLRILFTLQINRLRALKTIGSQIA